MITTNIPEGTEVLIKATIKGPAISPPGRLIAEIATAFIAVRPDEIAGIAQHVEAEAPVDPARENHNLIELAIQQNAEIKFRYAKSEDTAHPHGFTVTAEHAPETRLIQPHEIFTSWRGDELVGGQDVHAGAYRTFRLDRIQGVVEPLH